MAHAFIHVASGTTLPFLSYLASGVITQFITSGSGNWAVQGPFTNPGAMQPGASLPGSSMAIAASEMASSLMQPFWAIPVVAIAGVGVQRVLGFMLVILLKGRLIAWSGLSACRVDLGSYVAQCQARRTHPLNFVLVLS